MKQFTPRYNKPEAGNKYYIRKQDGGYSAAIKGRPTDPECNVLSNCVGYAYGRFNEIGEYGECKYLAPVNAENFMKYKGDCEVGFVPKVGACMVWQKGPTLEPSDGAGHVAIVENVIDATHIVTSESSYGGEAFYTKTRVKGDGNWGQGPEFRFLGFIYNPATESEHYQIRVGDIVTFIGSKHYISSNSNVGYPCKGGLATVTKINRGAKHPYHLVRIKASGSNVYGWVDERDIAESPVEPLPAVGDVVNFTGDVCYNWQNGTTPTKCKGGKATVTKIYTDGSKHPYHLVRVKGSGATVWGFVDEGTFTIVRGGAGDDVVQ